MPGGFAPRFALEAGFLILLGVGAGYADLRPIVIVGLLAGGWLVVALIELAIWRSESRPVVAYAPSPLVPVAVEEPAVEQYPLRADAGEMPSEEVEAYTRVISGSGADEPDVPA